ncbi:DEAD/DEAH box helicase [Streptococcus oricebi]|uniref:DNA/RNA helicase n=1 Tax=Streptococcus oricebi TaxID=1547447 RepID=A0ABS5B3M2_9STRE|nr:DEAD/DEAH box helicase [Streptococcus oricebi]MBP2623431.1 DNA/RNA helicase [Streptococcus oricebi]
MKLEDCWGRLFIAGQLNSDLEAQAHKKPALLTEKGRLFCGRCASPIDKKENRLPIGAYYCRTCLLLGRIRSDQDLYYFPQRDFPKKEALIWQGQLTDWQQRVADSLLAQVQAGRDCLVHAVTGAGKTEMIYPLLASYLRKGQAVCLASPRIDVCLELHRRLVEDFNCPISLLHGQSEAYSRSPLVIATTHQLLKFYQAFDLLIIDEVDAFPYLDNAMLYQAVQEASKKGGRKVFLTATSTPELNRQVERGQLCRLSLPRRFHGNPLTLPSKVWLNKLASQLKRGKVPRKLLSYIKKQRKTGFPLLIFMAEIERGKRLAQILQRLLSQEKIGFVSSKTENRLDLVQDFRQKDLTILVTTTILERGVTFPGLDVFVLEAHHHLFTASALIQIAGRVGRSKERPSGQLIFFHEGSSLAIEEAIREIKAMNEEAGL